MTGHGHSHSGGGSGIGTAFFLNLIFCLIELVGGYLTNSVAILSDALHDFGDSFSLGLAWYFQRLSRKKRDSGYSYGYRRFSLLGALINSVVLFTGSIFVIVGSVGRLTSPEPVNAGGMFAFAVAGVLINGIAVLRLRRDGSLNARTVWLHLMEDVLGWSAVLVAGAVMMFVDVPVLDPLLSLVIAGYILFNIYRNLRDTLKVILQGTPEGVSGSEIEAALLSVRGVESVHDLHLWTMDGRYNISSVHVVVGSGLGVGGVKAVKGFVRGVMKRHNIQHSTIEIEQGEEECEYSETCC